MFLGGNVPGKPEALLVYLGGPSGLLAALPRAGGVRLRVDARRESTGRPGELVQPVLEGRRARR